MGARSWFASARRPRSAQNRARLVAARNSQDFACCLRASSNARQIEASPSARLFCARSTKPRLRWSSGFHWPSPVLATLCRASSIFTRASAYSASCASACVSRQNPSDRSPPVLPGGRPVRNEGDSLLDLAEQQQSRAAQDVRTHENRKPLLGCHCLGRCKPIQNQFGFTTVDVQPRGVAECHI